MKTHFTSAAAFAPFKAVTLARIAAVANTTHKARLLFAGSALLFTHGSSRNANIRVSGSVIKMDAIGKSTTWEMSFKALQLPEVAGFESYRTYMLYGLK